MDSETRSPTRRRTVLVADDEPGTVALIADMLRYIGCDVVEARDGIEALTRVRERAPDLALIDVMMTGLDGREVCRRIRDDGALDGTRVILHSSADEADVDWRAAGADGFLQKPFSIRALPELVERYARLG